MAARARNERRFPQWEGLPDGGRRYWRIIRGATAGYARYVKVVGADEATLSIVQEIYDADGRLIATHEKFPVDTGHKRVGVSRGG